MEKFFVRVCDVHDVSKLNRINYLFKTKQIKKYHDKEGYRVYDEQEYQNAIKKKTGKRVK